MSNNSLQDLLTQVVMPFGGDSNLKKYANEKSPLRSELYSTEQLEQYASTLANSHLLSTGLMSDTLINRLEENRAMLEEVHQLLIKSAREGQLISPAGEWLLDNYYLISEQITRAKKHFPKGYSKSLPRLAKGPSAGFPRVYDMAIELISHSDGRIDFKSLLGFVKAYQHVKTLKIGELWAIPIMLRLALLENLRRLSTQLAIDRHHVNIADYWADLMTSTAEKDPKSLIVVTADMAKSDPPMVSSFVAELSRRLNGKGPALALPLTWIEQRLSENGLTSQGLVHADTQKQAAQQVSMSNSIGSLRFLNSTNWREFVEATSAVEHILREDIDGIYEKMDFHTRDHYRHVVEKIAKNSDLSEEEIARMAISHSAENAGDSKKSHVGYYLIKQGRRLLERESGMKISTIQKFKLMLVKYPFPFYSASMIIFSLLLSGLLVMRNLADGVEWHWTLIIAFVSFIATSFLSVTFINWLITLLTDPYFFARMDFSDEIPDSARTMVVVPTIFKNINDFDGLVESMEVRFLANRKDNLLYALLTDFADADAESFPEESPLLLEASKRIEALNQKYGRESNDIFFLFHRPRIWNAKEGKWMGYERKRGKLSDLNNLILGKSAEHFNVIVGEKEAYQQVKYIITLDRDTQLPRDAAWKMVATIAHPLNKATFDTEHHRISEGYGILQPRVSTSLPDAEASWYQRLHSNEEGIDPYTRAVSDVYQDLLEEGSFIGKGIYDVAAFELALGDRLPENRILSHDLVEGCHARSGLISDVELYEEYPGQYLVDMSRRHRWIRGDWQIARWLFPKVPIAGNRKEKNPLSSLSRWKILDNLRRSFIAPCLLILLLFGWTISISPWFWTVTVVGIIIPTSILSFFWSLLAKPKDLSFAQQLNNAVSNLVNQGIQHSFLVVTLPYEAYLDIDAMIRTGWRMLISRKNLLQWDPFDGKKRTGLTAHFVKMWIAPALATIVLFILLEHSKAALFVASPVLVAWFISPLAAWIMSLPQTPILVRLSTRENIFLKKLARKTWGFFEYFVGAEDHFLPPDNYQEQPAAKLAHRTSPTNIGLYLLSNLSAYDFGYLPASRFIERAKSTFDTLSSLQRFRGHFYNWYDTITLQALTPKYISTVDSGNLAGHLLTLKEGILELKNQPIVQPNLFQGIKDTANVLAEKLKDNALLKSFQVDIASACLESPQTLSSVKLLLQDWTIISANLYQSVAENSEFMTKWWANALQDQCAEALKDLTDLAPWIELLAVRDLSAPMLAFLDRIPTLSQLIEIDHDFAKVLAKSAGPSTDADDKSWSNNVYSRLELGMDRAELMLAAIDKLAQQCILYSNYDYDFLYDSSQYLLAIGYNVDEHHKDHGNYDLLGSESRFGVFVAIAQNKIPQSSWFALGRQLTNPNGDTVLLSWSGSMFEYLMPMLVMPSFENTLLDHTHKAAVKSQIAQGINRGFPWGVSESGYNMIASNLDYQYRAFGVPGLGFKRGLSEDIVVAPYATIMALMVDPEESYANLRELQDRGYMGDWGYYEAIDYTPSRLPRGKSEVVIKSFMSHHQGMSMLSLAYLLLDQPMQRRFQSEPQFQATMLLLQEKIPQVNKFFLPNVDETDVKHEGEGPQMRVITTSNTPIPEVQLLSNGNYHVMVNNAGGGYSRWRDMAVTRWKEDSTCDNWGTFCYIKDLETNEYWSAAHQPSLRIADSYEVIFSQGRAEFRRKDNKFETHTEIIVSPEDDVEMRRTHITNRSRKTRTIEVTSYAEVVLNSAIGDALHPAFSNLFVQTKINHARDAILCTRRARAPEETPPWLFHLMKVHGATMVAVSYETSRDQFIGRGNQIHDPIVMTTARDLSGSEGPVLDPIVSIRYKITLEPQETVIVDMVYGISDQLDTCNVLIEKYQERHMIDRAFELAWTHSQVILRQINANEADAQLYGRLASSIIYANSALRAESAILIKNHRGQSGLWSYSVSGDLPIVLLQIEDNAQVDLVSQMVQARSYWKLKGLAVDLIIWNDDHGGYRQVLHNQILALIAPGMTKEGQEVPGGIFFRAADQITEEDRILFQTVARVIISDRLGSLEGQLNRRSRIKIFPPDFIPTRQPAQIAAGLTMPTDLKFNNGMGGYAEGGKEYVIYTSPTNITPAPWSNVIANPNFGTVISESGQSYTWIENAHELRLTPWNNDPVTDSGGEHFYLRDEESGTTWSPCPLPIRSASPYITRHGFGYSTFEHTEDGMHSMMQVFVDIEKSVKYTSIKLRNDNDRSRKISVTGYIEWVLGDLRYKSMMHVVTELELSTGAILARNSYSTEFEHRVAFFDVEAANKSITTDREEFFGRNGSVDNPEALRRTKLSGKTGAGFDPCAAIQVYLELASGEESELIFRLGAGANLNEASNLVKQTRGNITARNAFQAVKAFWGKTLSNLIISSPDPSFDILANGWLTYQTIACRIWARSGYYQSGGAFGFRDQLQDVMSLLQIEPGIARDQILLCASRQFVEGDVQHWWHPPMGRGVRTLCSDDYLWLPLVASKYVLFTGDQAVLDESIAYLEMRLLNANEHSVYDLPFKSQQSGTLYEHCVKAIEHGMRYGVHGLPLMGAGDWNDGMDRVGIEGKGESVWLAFFYFYVIKQFMRVAELRGDNEFILKYQQVSTDLQTNIEANAWDGKWYRRAYFDDGTPLGSSQNEECEIDSIAQSWSLISGAAKKDRSVQAMGQAGQRLIHRDGGFIQLFEPAFDKSDLNPGYIKGYVPGVRENGGQYTHAAIWMIMGFALMGDRERTSELISMINPINRSSSKDKVSVYKVEPYVIAADVYAIKEQLGRGGWTWYTGSAGWMYQLIVEHVIGIIREGNKLRLEPCLPVAWGQVEVQYKFASTLYVITLVASELASPIIIVDGAKQSGNEIQLVDDGIQHSVEFQY